MAVLEMRELPGKESRIDSAFLAGSSVGTLDAFREEVRVVERAGRVRIVMAGLSRVAPGCL